MSRMSSQSVSSYHPPSSYLSSWRCKGFGASGSASAAFLALSLGRTGSVDGHSIDRSILCFWRFIYIVSFCNLVPSVHNGWGDLRFFASYHRELHSQPAWSFRKKLLMCNHICHMSYVICLSLHCQFTNLKYLKSPKGGSPPPPPNLQSISLPTKLNKLPSQARGLWDSGMQMVNAIH